MSRINVVDALAAVNPVHAEDLPGAFDDQGARLHQQIVRLPRAGQVTGTKSPVSRRLTLAAAAGAVGVAAAAVIMWPGGTEPAYAATPPMLRYRPDGASASDLLRRLAQATERAAARRSGAGAFDYVQMQSQYLDTAAHRSSSSSAIRVVKEERWLAPDGSGRAVETEGQAQLVHHGDQDTMDAVLYQPTPRSDQRYGPGELSQAADLSALSTDPAVLAGQLARMRTAFGWSETAPGAPEWYRRIIAATGIAKQQGIPPALWAAMLRVLATTPGLTSQGTVADRVGRMAVAVSVDTTYGGGRPARLVLLFRPDDGTFLGEEHILITKYGDGAFDAYLNVKIPAVVEYRAVLAVGKADTDHARPAVGGLK